MGTGVTGRQTGCIMGGEGEEVPANKCVKNDSEIVDFRGSRK